MPAMPVRTRRTLLLTLLSLSLAAMAGAETPTSLSMAPPTDSATAGALAAGATPRNKPAEKSAMDDFYNRGKTPRGAMQAEAIDDVPVAEADAEFGNQQVFPEIKMQAVVSSTDVNRIVCNTDIKDVAYSTEKGFRFKISGKNLFLKFMAKKEASGEVLYATSPVEFFVICGDNTYTLVLNPKPISAQTIRLGSGVTERLAKNSSFFAGQPYEKKIQTLIRHAYTDDFPDTFLVEPKNSEVKVYKNIRTVIKRTVRIEGEGLSLVELIATPTADMDVTEKMFLNRVFSGKPLAIALEKVRVQQDVPFRVFIVERSAAEEF